ncbi:MAG: hypothetical protein U0838_07975 [Chloroflexota bacterium]
MTFFVLAEWRLRQPAIGSFVSVEEAEEYRRSLAGGGKGWHVLPVAQPSLPVHMLQARLERSGFYSGTGPFEEEAPR